jgi:hypothetical protein
VAPRYMTRFVEEYLEKIRRPATVAEIRVALREAGFSFRDHSVNWTLTRLHWDGRVQRPSRGRYTSDRLDRPPIEPPSGPGPQYVLRDGRLTEVASPPAENEKVAQAGLHDRLFADAKALVELLERAANRYPELAHTARQYADFLKAGIERVDVTAIWASGSSLSGFAQAYREQNIARTLSDPLEPQVDALLQAVVREHGAYIMGFEQGRNLVQRADEFAIGPVRLAEIQKFGAPILVELTTNDRLVAESTRILHKTVLDNVNLFGWATSRAGYSAYLIVRNGVRALIKFTVGRDPNVTALLSFVTAGSAVLGDPTCEFARAAISILQNYGQQLLIFFNHSPEMRAYVDWALYLLKKDQTHGPK